MPTGIRSEFLQYVACSAVNVLGNDCKSNLQSSAIYGAPGPLGINFLGLVIKGSVALYNKKSYLKLLWFLVEIPISINISKLKYLK